MSSPRWTKNVFFKGCTSTLILSPLGRLIASALHVRQYLFLFLWDLMIIYPFIIRVSIFIRTCINLRSIPGYYTLQQLTILCIHVWFAPLATLSQTLSQTLHLKVFPTRTLRTLASFKSAYIKTNFRFGLLVCVESCFVHSGVTCAWGCAKGFARPSDLANIEEAFMF